MRTNEKGIQLIKSFEGCRLYAYKPVATERYWTIGWGHYGPDVKKDMTITQMQADNILLEDLKKYEEAVENLHISLNENQFSALVSFAYNCGTGNLKKLVANRNNEQIAEAMLLYNKAGGKVLNGLVKRRNAERELFLEKVNSAYPILKKGSYGSDVKKLQLLLNSAGYGTKVDGIFGNATKESVMAFQIEYNLVPVDGIVGRKTWTKLLED